MDGICRIDQVVRLFDVWLDAQLFPFAKMKVKVLERSTGDFLAVANLNLRNHADGIPEYLAGLGNTIDESVSDLLSRFISLARQCSSNRQLSESDFEWSAPEDF